jgi:hypothetical protein
VNRNLLSCEFGRLGIDDELVSILGKWSPVCLLSLPLWKILQTVCQVIDKSGTCHGLLQELEIKLLCWKVTWYECLGWSMISDLHNPYVLQFLSAVYC